MKKVILVIVAILIIIGIIIFQKGFGASPVENTAYEQIDINSNENVYTYNDKIYVYGKSGLKIYKNTELIFQDTFSAEIPYAIFSADKLIVGDKNGKTLRVYGDSDILYSINHIEDIIYSTINGNGYSAIISKSDSSTYEILAYNSRGDNIFHLTNITYTEGVPISLALSDNNKILAVTFLNIEGAIMESNISIYSLSSEEDSNNIVFGAFKRSNQMAGIIKFLTDENLLILSESEFSIVSIKESSKTVREIVKMSFNNKINFASFLNGSSFALAYGEQLTRNQESAIEKNSVIIYNSSGGKSGQINFEGNITNVFSNQYGIVICKDRFFVGYSPRGEKIFEYQATQDIKAMYFFNSTSKAILVTENEIKIFSVNKNVIKLLEEYDTGSDNLDYNERETGIEDLSEESTLENQTEDDLHTDETLESQTEDDLHTDETLESQT